mgnify:FL=1
MLKGSCHCGAVTFEVTRPPEWRNECNCSVCRRLGTLWGYFDESEVRFTGDPDATEAYVWGDRMLAFHRCKTCGCTTHWIGLEPKPKTRMAVNTRLMEPGDMAGIRLRHFDGADTFEYLD